MNTEDKRALEKLGQHLRQLRGQRSMSTSDLANTSGLTQRRIGRIEAGEVDQRFDELIALADGLGIKASELFAHEQK